jgi:hypothetical protein
MEDIAYQLLLYLVAISFLVFFFSLEEPRNLVVFYNEQLIRTYFTDFGKAFLECPKHSFYIGKCYFLQRIKLRTQYVN